MKGTGGEWRDRIKGRERGMTDQGKRMKEEEGKEGGSELVGGGE